MQVTGGSILTSTEQKNDLKDAAEPSEVVVCLWFGCWCFFKKTASTDAARQKPD